MMKANTLLTVLTLASALGGTTRAWSDDLGEQGRAIFAQHQHAVVTVEVALKSKISVPGRDPQSNESRADFTGTVVDASGLTALSLSAIDPTRLLEGLVDESRVKVESEFSEIKILLEDGTELVSEIVLRDKDLDLAFIRPKTKPATPMAALDLTKDGQAQILDQVVSLNRLGKAAGRAYAASAERISAVVQKPRLFYIPETSVTTTSLGAPAFTLDGKVLGMFAMRALKAKGAPASSLGPRGEAVTGIILPAADILKAAQQVPAASPEKTTPEATKTPDKP